VATVIAGGTVVGPDGSVPADVLVDGGRVVEIGEVDRSGAEVIDASACLVLPGAIDVHTHPFGGLADDSRSALCGGTTSALVVIVRVSSRPCSLPVVSALARSGGAPNPPPNPPPGAAPL